MSFKSTAMAALLAAFSATAAFADGIELHDAYARASTPMAKSGAAFMMIHNHGGPDDRLIGAASPVAERVELHTHIENDEGVMRMVHVEEGFELPTDGEIHMKRGGRHVMFLGLNESFEQGKKIPLTLVFEKAGEMAFEIEVDLERQDSGHDHGDHDHGDHDHSGHDHSDHGSDS